MSALWRGDITIFDFVDNANTTIELYFRSAWREAIAPYGLTMDELTDAESNRLTDEINRQIGFLLPFANAIVQGSRTNDGKLLPLLQRAALWVRELERIRILATNLAMADQKAEWVVGPTEHCETCLFYEGKVYRRSVWMKYLEPLGLLPRTKGDESGLDCKGFRCQCDLAPTDKPVTPGRPPIWKPGRKHHHDEVSRPGHSPEIGGSSRDLRPDYQPAV